jgi:quinoprotein dehydrogenase-associated probable ABC transporter substrate-binding protein
MTGRWSWYTWLGIVVFAFLCLAAAPALPRTIRIAADPNNLPFTNQRLEGFENRIAELLGRELNARIDYQWRAQRRGFFRQAFQTDSCDLVLGVPAGFERAATTKPYYRSGYVFVTRRDRGLVIRSLDDPALRTLRVGVQLVGDDGAETPPAHELARRGIVDNLVGFTLYGDYSRPSPPAAIVDAVAEGRIDVAVVWGPLAGYFARGATAPLELTAVMAESSVALPLAFDIAIGVRREETALRAEIDAILQRNHAAIDSILGAYGVPRLPSTPDAQAVASPGR